LQSERNATLFIDVLRSYVVARKFQVHDFVVMPNHVHLLITVQGDMTIEKALQFVKGGFSYWLRKELGYGGEVWQRGFSDVRVDGQENFLRHRQYIAENPVKARLADSPGAFPYCFTYLRGKKQQGLKSPLMGWLQSARLKPCPDTRRRPWHGWKPLIQTLCSQPGKAADLGRQVRYLMAEIEHSRGGYPRSF